MGWKKFKKRFKNWATAPFKQVGKLWKNWTGETAAEDADKNRELSEEQFEKNYQNMLEQQQYEKELQQKIFDREDNAYQRKVQDLKASGLSPILAAGGSGAGAGQAIKLTTPQRPAATKDLSGVMAQQSFAQSIPMIIKTMADITKTVSQNDLIKAQQNKTNISAMRESNLTTQEKKRFELDMEYASKTLADRIQQQSNIEKVSSAQMQKTINESKKLQFDVDYERMLKEYIIGNNKTMPWGKDGKGSYPATRQIMEYNEALLKLELAKKENNTYYMREGLKAAGAISNIVK